MIPSEVEVNGVSGSKALEPATRASELSWSLLLQPQKNVRDASLNGIPRRDGKLGRSGFRNVRIANKFVKKVILGWCGFRKRMGVQRAINCTDPCRKLEFSIVSKAALVAFRTKIETGFINDWKQVYMDLKTDVSTQWVSQNADWLISRKSDRCSWPCPRTTPSIIFNIKGG